MSHLVVLANLKIPLSELRFSFAASSGPGGQHVNKTSTKAILSWNITESTALSQRQRTLILSRLKHKLSARGDLVLHESGTRSQTQNKKAAIKRLVSVLQKALYVQPKRRKTSVPPSVKRKRLRDKKSRGQLKKLRTKGYDGDL